MAATSSRGISGVLNEFIKGALWGFVAFVHVALITVLSFKFAVNCFPADIVQTLTCLPQSCPATCDHSTEFYFYILSAVTVLAFLLLPLGFGIFWVLKAVAPSEK